MQWMTPLLYHRRRRPHEAPRVVLHKSEQLGRLIYHLRAQTNPSFTLSFFCVEIDRCLQLRNILRCAH